MILTPTRTRILVVDDDSSVCELLTAMFERLGSYEVETALSGEEAQKLLDERPFQLVITDLVMPGLDGFQLVEHIRNRYPSTKTLVISGMVHESDPRIGPKLGPFIAKPFMPTELTDAVRKALGASVYCWEIEIGLLGRDVSPSRLGRALFSLGEALHCVGGELVIDSFQTGSIWTKIKAFFTDPWTKAQAKDVLAKTRDRVQAELERGTEEVRKTRAEAAKAEADVEATIRTTDNLPTAAEARLDRQLDLVQKELTIREQRARIEKMELENSRTRLQLVREAAELAGSSLLAVDPVHIRINGMDYLRIEGGQPFVGVCMDEIESAEGVTLGGAEHEEGQPR